MPELSTELLNVAERALDVSAARQRVIANNMANVDTPGYHTRDIDFAGQLRQMLGEASGGSQTTLASRNVPGLVERPDGNNVNVERESLLMAHTQLEFNTAIQVIRSEFKRIQMAIQEQ
ncbi:flagellar basal-body rod protein FlgB [Candidatus Koribacter versatilis Ellin345]|uniref:Flagellar basal body rod protein FlgB n=1 Tax=Koribacter versatilis (strain Ellin345) TaxID=204669 RepID=Q1IR43_KORVE|nr:flagellar basal body protein [Candidatus Koribacter versatilis]ABF40657.1 flagellar basal-body rod protein FlgB [Candidatus Koribacter versatilis Ellin345]